MSSIPSYVYGSGFSEANISSSAIGSVPTITLEGRSRLEIEGCRSITEVTDLCIRLDMKKYRLSIIGENMSILNISGQDMTILGVIHSLSLEEAF